MASADSLAADDGVFADLDDEIAHFEDAMLRASLDDAGKGLPSDEAPAPRRAQAPPFRRLLDAIRRRLHIEDSDSDSASSADSDTDYSLGDAQQCAAEAPAGAVVTCRMCDAAVAAPALDEHSAWCRPYQECLIARDACQRHVFRVLEALAALEPRDRAVLSALDLARRALSTDEDRVPQAAAIALGRQPPSVRIARIQYRLAVLEADAAAPGAAPLPEMPPLLRRLRFLVDRKRVLADRFAELHRQRRRRNVQDARSGGDAPAAASDDGSTGQQQPLARLARVFQAVLRPPGAPPASMPRIADFEIVRPLSRGAFGCVFLARKRTTGDLFALKAIDKADVLRKNMASRVLAERRVLSLIAAAEPAWVVRLYYAFEGPRHLYLVMEYLPGGDLSAVLRARGRLSVAEARFYAAELVLALEALHGHGVIHRDVKPDNMLLDAEGHVRLTDLGLAEARRPRSLHVPRASWSSDALHASASAEASPCARPADQILGTPDYIAPEVLAARPHGPAADLWAAGVCLYEFLVGIPPFNDYAPAEVFARILRFQRIDWALPALADVPPAARDLVDRLLRPDPQDRPDAAQIRAHAFFVGVDWAHIRDGPGHVVAAEPSAAEAPPLLAAAADHMAAILEDMRLAEPMATPPVSERGRLSRRLRTILGRSSSSHRSGGPGAASDPASPSPSGITSPSAERVASPFAGFAFKNIPLLDDMNKRQAGPIGSSSPRSSVSSRPA